MFVLRINDRELRQLSRLLDGDRINDDEAARALQEKVEQIVDENIDALERIAIEEDDEDALP
jgi:tRNA(His) 5'-end guanylyltransferase